MIRPPFLTSGDTVAFVSTARRVIESELVKPIEIINSWGFNVITAPGLFNVSHQFAGADESRISDFQWCIDNPDVKAIICVRGGYGSVRIIDQVNFENFFINPKWVCGYSDVTVLHNHLNSVIGVESIHSTMPINFQNNTSQSLCSLKDALLGDLLAYKLKGCTFLKGDSMSGELIGGNLSIIYSLMGSKSQLMTNAKILFIEDIDEMLYHLDRMLVNLSRSGMLDNLGGLIVGGMTDMRDNTEEYGFGSDNRYGLSAKEIILERTKNYNFPILWGFPSGHLDDNLSWYSGRKIKVKGESQQVHFDFI